MAQIKFSHEYPKLWNQKRAELIAVRMIGKSKNFHKDLIEYDTKFRCNIRLDHHGNEQDWDEDYYKLQEGVDFIQLVFIGGKLIPFCTIRRYTKEKYEYYQNMIGEEFEVVRDSI